MRKELAASVAAGALDPLDVLREAMRLHWEAKEIKEAVAVAALLIPYFHRRKAPESAPPPSGSEMIEVRVIRDRNFYGNENRLPALDSGPSGANPAQLGTV